MPVDGVNRLFIGTILKGRNGLNPALWGFGADAERADNSGS
jgi:hypothetical protein